MIRNRILAGRLLSATVNQSSSRHAPTTVQCSNKLFHAAPLTKSPATASTDWKDWFPPGPLNSCPWDKNPKTAWLQPLKDPAVDYPTRHAIQLLQDFYRGGGARASVFNVITTTRCNMHLQQMLEMQKSSRKDAPAILHRANALVQTMQLFDESLLQRAAAMERGEQVSRPQYLLPHPDAKTYQYLLRLYADTPSMTREVPDAALEIVRHLQSLFDATRDSSLQPKAAHYNCVLSAWLHCKDWQKAAHAAQVFLQDMTNDTRDASSFVLFFKLCTMQDKQLDVTKKELGGLVALEVWQQVVAFDDHVPLKSHAYVHFLQAIRHLSLDHKMRAAYFHACFQRAVTHGKVNTYLINELIVHCKSPRVFENFLGQYKYQTLGMKPAVAAQAYWKLIPDAWKCNADFEPIR
ncbi:hypothetical protein MPSEU_000944900 [Mayamaea pseudoterrestris]|nr:hypothetical protein MPSEU_000944900 [Mayamaea pseudoterrestris]